MYKENSFFILKVKLQDHPAKRSGGVSSCISSTVIAFANEGEDESVRNNLSRYSLEHCYVDMLVSDISRSVWREQEIVDAIITDRRSLSTSIIFVI